MKIGFVSSMLPSGHFSQILTHGIARVQNVDLSVYTDADPANLSIRGCGTIRPTWKKGWRYMFDIIRAVQRDRPDCIHIQQEFSMYGGFLSALLFPFVPFYLKLLGSRTVVTIHATVFKREITRDFIYLFIMKPQWFITPVTLRAFFHYTFFFTGMCAERIICHTELLKQMLIEDYSVKPDKITVIPTGVPERTIVPVAKQPYFFYFGYFVRRKGLDAMLTAFQKFHRSHPEFKLVVAGGTIPGQEAAFAEIETLIDQLGIRSAVMNHGFVEDEKLAPLYGEAVAVLLPAKVSMGSSGPLYHAQSFGKCVLASNIGHLREDIRHLYDGILVDNDKWEEVMEFAANHPEIIEEIEQHVREKAVHKNVTSIAERHVAVYRSVINGEHV